MYEITSHLLALPRVAGGQAQEWRGMIDSLLNPMNLALTIDSYGVPAKRPTCDSVGATLHAIGMSRE
jgi:hypothetical protein